MIGTTISAFTRIYSGATKKRSPFRNFLSTSSKTFEIFVRSIFALFTLVGMAVFLLFHPSDNLTETFYEEQPRWLVFFTFMFISFAAIYGLSVRIRVRAQGSSRLKYFWYFFYYSALRVLILLMIVTCFYLLYVRDAFADEVILRTDLFKHYVVIFWDAVTVDLTRQWQEQIFTPFGLTSLEYDPDGFYGLCVRLFKVAIIVIITWAGHKAIVFKTPEERSADESTPAKDL